MHDSRSDTIAAIATPPGQGGIAVLRMSGPDALRLLHGLFTVKRPVQHQVPDASSPFPAFSFRPRYMHFGYALDGYGERLDEVLAVFMPGPHSATGEDVGEIHCHGGPGVTTALLEAAQRLGARLAEPGEFTRRAFLNGRMDLTQAEAVAELTSAPTAEGARLAAAKLDGVLGREVAALRRSLDALRVQVTVAVDFPDEDVELLSNDAFRGTLRDAQEAVQRLLSGFERGRIWNEGASAVLAGRVNVGKSSLLNALLGRNRAIVSDEAGTTRDYIEERINLAGLPLRIVDTAGLRRDGGIVEHEGMRRSRELAHQADMVICVLDARVAVPPGMQADFAAAAYAGNIFPAHACPREQLRIAPDERDFLLAQSDMARKGSLVLVLNKIDALGNNALSPVDEASLMPLGELEGYADFCPVYALSARDGHGLPLFATALRDRVCGRANSSAPSTGTDTAPNLRQSLLLKRTADELDALSVALTQGFPPDIIGVHLDSAAMLLGDVTGSSSTEELLDQIFSSFCIGK